ncbi:hypothetical protein ABIB73_005015 [Bradyrhizobium sp. F1.4.3]
MTNQIDTMIRKEFATTASASRIPFRNNAETGQEFRSWSLSLRSSLPKFSSSADLANPDQAGNRLPQSATKSFTGRDVQRRL